MGVSEDRALWLAAQVMPHEPAVRGWLRRGRHLHVDIDDIIQEAYAKLVSLPDVAAIDNVRAYFFRTAWSVVADRMRRKDVISIASMAEVEHLQAGIDEITPEDSLAGRNELQILADMMERLPDKTRRVFVLRRVSGLSQKEVSRRTGIPESTVEKHIAKAIRLLMVAYADGGYDAVIASRLQSAEKGRRGANGRRNQSGD
jgi:RNA polymerase sigma factor (sigma-70 family)